MELEIEGAKVSATTVHPGGIKTNIARNARMDASVADIAGDAEKGPRDFERVFITSPEKAARQILTAVQRDRRRALDRSRRQGHRPRRAAAGHLLPNDSDPGSLEVQEVGAPG